MMTPKKEAKTELECSCFHVGSTISFLLLVGFVFVDDAGLHDEVDVLEDLDVFERIAIDGDDVGPLAGFDRAGAVGPCHEVGCVDGAGLNAGEGDMPN